MNLARARTLLTVLLLSALGCTRTHNPGGTDSETHFLRACHSDKECGASSCLCGVCTRSCESSSACEFGALVAACVQSDEPSCNRQMICDAPCTDTNECALLGDRYACSTGHCRVQTSSPDNPHEIDSGVAAIRDASAVAAATMDAATMDAATTGADTHADTGTKDAAGLDATASVSDAGMQDTSQADTGLPLPRSEGQPCTEQSACAADLVCARGACAKDPCLATSCAFISAAPDAHPCVAASATRDPCNNGTCPTGFICHIDNTCVAPGACDSAGVATVGMASSSSVMLMAIDADYLYGTDGPNSARQVARWSIASGERTLLADGDRAPPDNTMLVDSQALYWVGPKQALESTPVLWRLQLSPLGTPELLGADSGLLAQDAGYLYLTSDDRKTLFRIAKSNPDVRESIASAPAGTTFYSIAANSNVLMLSTWDGAVTYQLQEIDKRTLEPIALPVTDPPFIGGALPLLVDDDYCFADFSRFNFKTQRTAMLPLDTHAVITLPIDGRLYAWQNLPGTTGGEVLYVDMETGLTTSLRQLTGSEYITLGGVVSRAGVFVTTNARLMRVALPGAATTGPGLDGGI